MARSVSDHHASTPAELSERLAAGRTGRPFVAWRATDGQQRIVTLTPGERASVGRGSRVDVDLAGDGRVSRLHAVLEEVAGTWVLVDDGLSRHGSRVNGDPVRARRRLEHGDVMTLGETPVVFLAPEEGAVTHTLTDAGGPAPPLTEADRRLLDALCEPLWSDPYAPPAANRDLAETLYLSEARVKARLGSLFVRFEVSGLPQNRKRAELAARAVRMGVVRPVVHEP